MANGRVTGNRVWVVWNVQIAGWTHTASLVGIFATRDAAERRASEPNHDTSSHYKVQAFGVQS